MTRGSNVEKGKLVIVPLCSRCFRDLDEEIRASRKFMGLGTIGYYEVVSGYWSQFADPGEKYLCDACVWSDPRYIAVYGVRKP